MRDPNLEKARAYYSGRMLPDERDEFELLAGSDPQFAKRVLLRDIENGLERSLADLRAAITPPANLKALLAAQKAECWRERLSVRDAEE